MSCLRKLLKIRWQDMVPNSKVLTKASTPSVHRLLQKIPVRWAGHVTCMSDDRLPRAAVGRTLWRQKLSWRIKEALQVQLQSIAENAACWGYLLGDPSLWFALHSTLCSKCKKIFMKKTRRNKLYKKKIVLKIVVNKRRESETANSLEKMSIDRSFDFSLQSITSTIDISERAAHEDYPGQTACNR